MGKKLIFIILAVVISVSALAEQNLILIRHAEKQHNSPDPALTAAGYQQSSCFASWLSKQSYVKDIKVIYSSNYRRTLSTAATIAVKLGVPVRLYSPGKLGEFAEELEQLSSSAVVVGHSNTTPMLSGILAQEQISAMDESNYDSFWHLERMGKLYLASKLNQQQLGCN